jgi:hypothetical protein
MKIMIDLIKRYHKHEFKRLSGKRKGERERSYGDGRPFKLDVKGRLLIPLVYFSLYIIYPLTGLSFDMDQSSIRRDIHKIESLVRQ